MNEESHWNKIAHSYEDEIFDVFKSDKDKKLPGYFKKYANKDHLAIDLGCGIGKAFPFLSPSLPPLPTLFHFTLSYFCMLDSPLSGPDP